MSELAFNINGDSFEFTDDVTDLRAKRLKPRGAPELVYGRDGRPVTVSVNATIEELRDAVGGVVGKYRLDPLNADGKLVEGCPAAYIQIVPPSGEPAPAVLAPTPVASEAESVVRDVVRVNADLARTVISTFPAMMDSAARLIAAADGAGISRRRPHIIDVSDESSDGDDGDETEDSSDAAPTRPAGLDANALIAQFAPMVAMGIMNGKFDLSKLGELFDWRKAAAAGKRAATEKTAARAATGTTSASNASARSASSAEAKVRTTSAASTAAAPNDDSDDNGALPPLDPAAMAHFLAIQSALGADEAAMAREVASTLSPRELRAWMSELRTMSVPDAVAAIRKHIHPQAQPSNTAEVVS